MSGTVIIHPGTISGRVAAPASKSVAQRAFAAAMLASGTSYIYLNSWCADTLAVLDGVEQMGVEVTRTDDGVVLNSRHGLQLPKTVQFGESGLATRMFTPLLACFNQPVTITGRGSLLQRSMSFFDEVLPQLEVDFSSDHGHLPFRLKGPLVPHFITVDGSASSQYLTGLLMAMAYNAKEDAMLKVNNLKSKPYIDLTLEVMRAFGIRVSHEDYVTFWLHGPQQYQPTHFRVEGDWSGAAFLLVAGAINGGVRVSNLNFDSAQADQAITMALQKAGAVMHWDEGDLIIQQDQLLAFDFDATDCPDLFPPLAALAACCAGISRLKGVHRLANKESDRGVTICMELQKLGVLVRIEGDEMLVTGGVSIAGGVILNSHNDHRIAMMNAVLGTVAKQAVTITDAEAVSKSYPGFYDDLQQLHITIENQ
jgi:3-phosphoshikimate 1-carboxyvinyltransferase